MRVVAVSAAAAASAKNVAASVAHMAAEHAHKHAAAQKEEERSVFGWWDIIQHGSRAELLALLSPKWWVKYIADEFEAEPAHVIVEVICIVTIFYLLVLRKPAPVHHEKLSAKVRCSTHTHSRASFHHFLLSQRLRVVAWLSTHHLFCLLFSFFFCSCCVLFIVGGGGIDPRMEARAFVPSAARVRQVEDTLRGRERHRTHRACKWRRNIP
jgi:hypothetical protein